MDLLGIGPLELIMIFVIILLVLGPNEMVKAGRTMGTFIRKVMTSDGWKAIQTATKEIRRLPTTLAREAALEEFTEQQAHLEKDLNSIKQDMDLKSIDPALDAWTSAPKLVPPEPPSTTDPTPTSEDE